MNNDARLEKLRFFMNWIKGSAFLAFGILCTCASFAETVDPSVSGEDNSPTSPTKSKLDSDALDYLYNRTGTEGSAVGTLSDDYRKGKEAVTTKQNALDSIISSESLLLAGFEEFLSFPEARKEEITRYQTLYKNALKFLNERNTVDAWQVLFELSNFEWDAGLSKQIANRVRSVWDTDSTARELLSENDKLQYQVRTANWNADGHAASLRREQEERSRRKGSSPSPVEVTADSAKGQIGNLRMTEEYFKSLDSKARIKLNEIKIGNIKTKARSDLVDYITTLYKSKKFSHAVLAAEFYQALFKDGDLPPEVANQATAALEASRSISRAVEVFRFKVKQKQVATASTILFKAWQIGDNTPDMVGLERDLKLPVIDHSNRVRRMRNLIEARNFETLDGLLSEIELKSTDFDTTKPRALVQAIKLDSSMRLGKARLFAQQGNAAKAMEEFRAAAEIWPGNPDLTKASSEYFAVEDASARNMTEFDREISEKNFRAIADKQVQFLHFVQSDEKRRNQFKGALEKVRDAETALEKARMQDRSGDFPGAWETIETALVSWPEDQRLNQSRAEYSSKAPEFVSAVRRAQAAEREKDLGASMSLFALARRHYPPSAFANDGLKRVSSFILEQKVEGSADSAVSEIKHPLESKQPSEADLTSKVH